MGIINSTVIKRFWGLAVWIFLFSSASVMFAEEDSPSLGEAFNAGAPEVEPVVVGREKWNDNQVNPQNISVPDDRNAKEGLPQNGRISELEPLETQQIKPDPSELPLDPPKIKPATKIVRNFEGVLVFKPRKFGFAYDFPYQLENAKGKRLAFIDVDQLKAVDPKQFVDKGINVMGKLEPLEEGSDDLVIRARVIRPSN